MSSCLVERCPVDMHGQMLVCSPHWTFLSQGLRAEVIDTHNGLAAQLAVGNPRRATREAWRALLPRVSAELAAAHAGLERDLGRAVPPSGVEWRRAGRAIARAAADGTAEP